MLEPWVRTGDLQTLFSHLNPLNGVSPGASEGQDWCGHAEPSTDFMLSGFEEGPGIISGQVQGATHGGELGVLGETPS